MEGLIAIGATERGAILKQAVAVFGPTGPSEDDTARGRQLAALNSRQEKRLDHLSSQYYAIKENIEMLLTLYAVEHKEDFVATQ